MQKIIFVLETSIPNIPQHLIIEELKNQFGDFHVPKIFCIVEFATIDRNRITYLAEGTYEIIKEIFKEKYNLNLVKSTL